MRPLALAFVLAALPAAAQGGSPYASPFIPFSAEAQGVSEAGAFGPAADPLRLLDNPAVLADFAGGVTVSGDRLPDWLGVGDFSATAAAIAGGVEGTLGGRPASLGVGLAAGRFEGAPLILTDEQGVELGVFDPGADEVLALGVGGAVEGPVRVRAGAAVRRLASAAVPSAIGEADRYRATAADLGLDVTLPLGRWLQPAPDADGYRFDVELTAGYALRGIGLADAAPDLDPTVSFTQIGAPTRTPSAGVRLLTAVVVDAGTPRAFRGAALEVLTGAEDPGAQWFGLSAANVLLGESDESSGIVGRRGLRLTLAETLTLSLGAQRGGSIIPRESRGLTVSLGGALRGLARLTDDAALAAWGRRVDLRYSTARYVFDEGDSFFGPSRSHGLVLRVRP